MLWFGLKKRINRLEERLDSIQQKQSCAAGLHEWVVRESYAYGEPPFIRCKHCYAKPEKEQAA